MDEDQAQAYIDTFFESYKDILPYFQEEYQKLTGLKISERVFKNPVTGRIRRFPRGESDKLMREMKATLLQQVESHLLKVSLVRLGREIGKKGLDARIVACIHDSIWVEASDVEAAKVRQLMQAIMTEAGESDVPLEVEID